MNISLYLAQPSRETSNVVICITHHGKRYKKTSGISLPTASWSTTKQRTNIVAKQTALKAIVVGLQECLTDLSTERDIECALGRIKDGKWQPSRMVSVDNHPTFWEYFKTWSEKEVSSKRQHTLTYRTIADIMGHKDDWDDLTDQWFYRLQTSLEDRGMSVNYIGNHISRLHTVIANGHKMGWHTNTAYQHLKRCHEDAFSIALTASEMDALWNAELSVRDGRVRDMAWLGYLTASRFSDYSRLRKENIVNGRITFVQKKTDDPVLIPCSPRVMEILERNGGRAPKMCEQAFNRNFKKLCQKVGINEIIQVPQAKRRIMGWGADEPIEKWRLCQTHTLRRSALTNLYLSGVPIALCMKVSGHKTIACFQKYIKLSAEEAASKMEELSFFK